ncbi:DUF6331 family protein [Pedosphaera parvula]|nr:DUF6331 family protein [Pedosphaera parvula]
MPKPNPNDISIGKDQWITFIDVIGQQGQAVSIDHLVDPLESFWTALESNCVAGCCGIDALSLWPEDIQKASSSMDRVELLIALVALREFAVRNENKIFVSTRLNNYFHKQVLLQIIDHIQAHVMSTQIS